MSAEFETLQVDERADRIVVALHRPDARNAINSQMVADLHAICLRLEVEPRPLLLTGSDGSFAAGADIAQLRERGRAEAMQGINRSLFDRIATLPMPTVAAIEGPALGGGAELAYACDMRLATPTAVFGNPEPGLGILAAAGACWRLGELVGKSVARAVLLGGAMLDADRAYALGLVMEVTAPDSLHDRAHSVIDRMVRAAPTALRMTKLVLDAPAGAHPLVDDLAQAVLFEMPDKQERMTAFLERRSR